MGIARLDSFTLDLSGDHKIQQDKCLLLLQSSSRMRFSFVVLGFYILSLNLFQSVVSILVFRKSSVVAKRNAPINQWFVQFDTIEDSEDTTEQSRFSIQADFAGNTIYSFPSLNGFVVEATNEDLKALGTNVVVERDQERRPTDDETELIVAARSGSGGRLLRDDAVEYNLEQIQVPQAHEITTGRGVKVCIIDTGVSEHVDLDLSKISGLNSDLPWYEDLVGHGTFMAGVIAAIPDNNVGIVGIAPDSEIYVVRVFRESGIDFEYSSDIVNAAFTCVEKGAKVINMSLGGTDFQKFEEDGLTDLVERFGVLIVAAAGNGGPAAPKSYPASYTSVLSVTAIDPNLDRWPRSQVNELVDIAAPGVRVKSILNEFSAFEYRSGTSVACAHVSGVAALLWSHRPDATVAEIKAALLNSAKDLGLPTFPGRDDFYGHGLVQAMDAISYLDRTVRSPTIAPTVPPTIPPPSSQQAPTTQSLLIACQFIQQPVLSACLSTTEVYSLTLAKQTIPNEIGLLTQLSYLSLSGNDLTGSIPTSIGRLTQLTYLSLRRNFLVGGIPSSLGSLTQLEVLSLWSNSLTGRIPSSLGSLTRLDTLWLGYNELSGSIPSSIGRLTQLSSLEFLSNSLTGTIPSWLQSLTLLGRLDLDANRFRGPIPSILGQLTQLTTLYLSDNLLTGAIPSSFSSLTQLTSLALSENALTGRIPTYLGDISLLRKLILYENLFTSSIPSSLGSLTRLTQLELDQNQLTGVIPSSLQSLTLLGRLELWSNRFRGPIPSILGRLTQLTSLYLAVNSLTGTIPSALSSLVQLTTLDLSVNQLTGGIPSFIGSSVLLWKLFLYDNALTGSIIIPASRCYTDAFRSIHCWEIQCNCCVSEWPDLIPCL